jgi:hypothetical protein
VAERGAAPLVTVVVDNYNYQRFLRRSLDSALDQTYPHVEVVLVDDGSTDGSVELARSYGDRIVLVAKENGGQASAVNAGFAAARGEFVLFLDADDELARGTVQAVVTAFAAGPAGLAKVHWRLEQVDGDGGGLGTTRPPAWQELPEGDLSGTVLRRGTHVAPPMSGNAYPRWVLSALLPMPEQEFRISADAYLISLAALHGPVAALPAEAGRYRVHGGNGWRPREVTADRVRLWIAADRRRDHAVREEAARLGLVPAKGFGLADAAVARARLAGVSAFPDGHPVPGDDRWSLLLRCLRLTVGDRSVPLTRRAVMTGWTVGMSVGRLAWRRRVTDWFYVPARRPWAERSPAAPTPAAVPTTGGGAA